MDKSYIRNYFLQRIDTHSEDNGLISKLESLTLFTIDNKFDMNSFYDNIANIISWEMINRIPDFIQREQNPEEMNFILNIQSWAIKAWKKGIETADLNKIIISYILIERLYLLPEEDLNWNIFSEKLKSHLEKVLPTLSVDIKHDYPRHISYSDKKYYKDYEEALKNKNYIGILNFLSVLDRSNHFHNDFVKILVKISLSIDPFLLAANISNYSPFLMRLIIKYLNNDQIFKFFEVYQEKNVLPLLIGLIQIIRSIEKNQLLDINGIDYQLIKKASTIIEKIVIRVETENLYKFLKDCNIPSNELWHLIFSAFISINFQYHENYINQIDFSDNTGEKSFDVFSHFSNNEKYLDTISCEVYERYLFLLVEGQIFKPHLFCFTTYYKYILHAIGFLSTKSFSIYLIKLEEVSTELKRGLYSWKQNEIPMLFTKWIFWLISSKEFVHDVEINKHDLRTTFDLLNDKRILNALSCKIQDNEIDFRELIAFLMKPDTIKSLILPHQNNAIRLDWSN